MSCDWNDRQGKAAVFVRSRSRGLQGQPPAVVVQPRRSSVVLLLSATATFLFFVVVSTRDALSSSRRVDPLEYVDVFIGTGGTGHTFPGPVLPFGRVQVSPDNGNSTWEYTSGYHVSNTEIYGFSQTHLSGTGIHVRRWMLIVGR